MRRKGLRLTKLMSDRSIQKRPGSVRVSTIGQTLEARPDQPRVAGYSRDCREKVSGAEVDAVNAGV